MVMGSTNGAASGDAVDGGAGVAMPGAAAGLGARVGEAVSILSSVLDELDPDRIPASDCTALYGSICLAERLVEAGKALLSARIEWSGIWETSGHRDAAAMLADLEGVSPAEARRTLTLGRRLFSLPGTEAALRRGELSGAKARELTRAGASDPSLEDELLEGAGTEPLAIVAERCRAARATASGADPEGSLRAIYAERRFSSWTDPEGAFCYEGRDTPDRGARLLAHLGPMAQALRRARRQAGEPGEPEAALRADALYALVCGEADPADPGGVGGETSDTGSPAGDSVGCPTPATVVVRVDRDALLRGEARPGEVCELEGMGPIPVGLARRLASDAFLTLCFHRAGEIAAVSHLGRTINATLKTALSERDRGRCVVPGCGTRWGLEIDHLVPFADGGPTELDNLALLCHHHHFLKSYRGWTLARTRVTEGGTPVWSFDPEPPFGQEPGLGIDTPEGRADWHRQRERERERRKQQE